MPTPTPSPTTFYRWLRRQTKRNDRVGDIARDVVTDHEYARAPRCGQDYEHILAHILTEHPAACLAALYALAAARAEYQRAVTVTANQLPTGR